PKLNVRSEQVFTGAILQVTSGRKTKVCLTSGHGEWSEDAGAGRSLSGVQKALRYDNVEFERIETLGKKTLSEECDAIFVLGPLRAFHAQEAELLADSVRSGHGLLLALDPVIERDRVLETGLEALAEEFGVRIDPTLVLELDTQRLASPSVVEFRVTDYLEHETTRPLAALGGVSFFRLARSVRPSDSGQASVLFRSSSASFGERDVAQVRSAQEPKQDPEDVAGPVPLAVAAQYSRRGDAPRAGRLVVVGDSDWLDASFLDSPVLSNVYLLAAFTGWLTERDALIALPPKKATLGHVAFDQAALSGLLLRAVVLMPLSALLIGVAVWWARRQ
ncbi:MAG: Gldg family protein, partial [Proteobacteria bacterium]|nr:Gldg family protein [Pseudomonadota bacterium]